MPNSLRIVSAATSAAATPQQNAARIVAARTPSPSQQSATTRLDWISSLWATLTDLERASFVALGQNYSVSATKTTSSGKNLFVHLNTYRDLCGMDILTMAPTYPDKLGKLPDFSLDIANASGAFSVAITPFAAFAHMVIVGATRPLTAGTVLVRRKDYQILEVMPSLAVGTFDVASGYAAVFKVPNVGNRVGVCLTPVSENGFLGQTLYHDAVVAAAP